MTETLRWEEKPLIGVVHLKALPGAPRFAGSMSNICAAAVADAQAYEDGGAQAIMIENFGDLPFGRQAVAPETVASMAVAAHSIRKSGCSLPLGFNVLRNDVSTKGNNGSMTDDTIFKNGHIRCTSSDVDKTYSGFFFFLAKYCLRRS